MRRLIRMLAHLLSVCAILALLLTVPLAIASIAPLRHVYDLGTSPVILTKLVKRLDPAKRSKDFISTFTAVGSSHVRVFTIPSRQGMLGRNDPKTHWFRSSVQALRSVVQPLGG